VRKLSGADSYARKISPAYEAGKLRRAFLKGISSNYACWYLRINSKSLLITINSSTFSLS
jgi:hypothetical protein